MMTNELNVRPMQLADLVEVLVIDRLSFSLPWPESAYRHELTENPAAMCWAAEIGEPIGGLRLVGMVVVWLIIDEAHIATIAVHPDYRGRGIGSQLLHVALTEAVKKGAKEAMLEVRANNSIAQAMYRRFGFQVVFRRPRYYRDNHEDALLMNLTDLPDKLANAALDLGQQRGEE
jgi:ribosomal-protein-alanine N-acetyltransferase